MSKFGRQGNIYFNPKDIRIDQFGEPLDNTNLNASITRHGLCPKLSGDRYMFLNGEGNWVDFSSDFVQTYYPQRLNALYIDGVTNLKDTDITLYTVPATWYVKNVNVVICNQTTNTGTIQLSHSNGVKDSSDYILYDTTLLSFESKTITLPGMIENDFLTIQSSLENVSVSVFGETYNSEEKIKKLSSIDISSIDTDTELYTTITNITDTTLVICNRNSSYSQIHFALVDSTNIGDLSLSDYLLYNDIIAPYSSKFYDIGITTSVDNMFVVKSTNTNVNFTLYGDEV